MSSYVVSKADIDTLVHARTVALRCSRFGGSTPLMPDLTDSDLGTMLWAENVASVRARYGNRHPEMFDGVEPTAYLASGPITMGKRFPMGTDDAKVKSLVAMLKAIAHYEYQSCEHEDWEHSKSRQYCKLMREYLIQCFPSYADAPWGEP